MQRLRLESIGPSDYSDDYRVVLDGREFLVVLAADVSGGIQPVIFELDSAGELVNERNLTPAASVAGALGAALAVLLGPEAPQLPAGVDAAPGGFMDVLPGAWSLN